jgi:hypothetical protein
MMEGILYRTKQLVLLWLSACLFISGTGTFAEKNADLLEKV